MSKLVVEVFLVDARVINGYYKYPLSSAKE